ncbi:MAG: hypothetical protein ABSC06_36030 [Rhodopila sp.]|jgi:hypothetical protein
MPNAEFDPNFDVSPTESDSADAAEVGHDPLDDAGRVAARAMIGGLMETSPDVVDAARVPGAVVVLISPASEWSDDLGAAWQPMILKRVAVAPHRDRWRKNKDLYVLLPSGDRSRIGKQDDDRNLAEAVTDGRGGVAGCP